MLLSHIAMTATAGLTSDGAARRLAEHGRNELPSHDRRSRVQMLLGVIREPMVVLLLIAIALYLGFGDLAEAIALAISVLVIVAITILQERRTERALDALRELASPRARVLRDGKWRELDARELVPGDIIRVGEGDRVPADVILRDGTAVTVDESLLTGESVPVVRTPDRNAATLGRPGEPGASLYSGTLIGSGNAIAEVIRTGADSEVGRIGAALGRIELARAPLHREVTHVVRRIAIVAVVLCLGLVAIRMVTQRDALVATLAGITLAMSLLPEELPLVLTVFLTLGAARMTRHQVLARRAASIETLGAVTVLCVDKTGTLTRNRMAICRVATAAGAFAIDADASELAEDTHLPLEYGLLACPQHATDPMDRAFARVAAQALGATDHVHPRWQWIREYPLSQGLLAVTHVWRGDDRQLVVATKGAPEAIIDLCHLDRAAAASWRAQAEAMASEGLRVLGVARAVHHGATPDHPHDYLFTMVGLIGLADPLRDGIAATIASCRQAGVRVIMITGDHPTTAAAIARQAGLRDAPVLSGPEIEQLADRELAARIAEVEVIARAAPAHKLRIIDALSADHEVVAMTGDGVNDAPALKAAAVGVAMGHGTDVAREAAGLVILDDSLAAIVAAIRTGRTIYDNLRKVAGYLLAVHVPIAGLALIPPLVGWPLMLAPVHIVLLELVIDPTCSIVFEREPPARDIMARPPRGHGEQLFALRGVIAALILGVGALIGPLLVLGYSQFTHASDELARVLCFVALIAGDLALVGALRGQQRGAGNATMWWMTLGVVVIVAATIAVPWLRALFGFAAPTVEAVALAALTGAAVVALAGRVIRGPVGSLAPPRVTSVDHSEPIRQ